MKSSPQISRSDQSALSNPSDVATPKLERPEFSGGDMGKIEEILLGKYIDATQNQLSQLHTYIETKMSSMVSTYEQKFTELNTKLDAKYEAFNRSLHSIEAENKKQFEKTSGVQNDLSGRLEKLSGDSDQLRLQLKSDIDSSSDSLAKQINTSYEDMDQRLKAAIDSLGNQKLDRDSLSTLLGEVAERLNDRSNQALSANQDSNKK